MIYLVRRPYLCIRILTVTLAGVIHNAEEETIKLINDLVISYIEESENTIVLITIPMSGAFSSSDTMYTLLMSLQDDIEMQAAVKLAKSRDPDGDRTIGLNFLSPTFMTDSNRSVQEC